MIEKYSLRSELGVSNHPNIPQIIPLHSKTQKLKNSQTQKLPQ